MSTSWIVPSGDNRMRVHCMEISRKLGEPTIASFHLETVFVNSEDVPLAKIPGPTWNLHLEDALENDPELAPLVAQAAMALEQITLVLYNRNKAA